MTGAHGGSLENDMKVLPGDRVVAMRAGVVYVIGDVGKPGGYVMDGSGGVTVVQALALAQGMNRTAKSSGMLIRNAAGGKIGETRLELNKILANKAPDPQLQDGDILYVPLSAAKDSTTRECPPQCRWLWAW